ncbi:hypothetical protein [Texcoconibacillus texcoconensis]|uniref:Uncharacterized protein n=1 Tax=Texcoconibacillus texcoconensis TaxID=1095777 RepID=A0A840QTG3_9BACI|nr:hypothetical protein [Texcoconibacillus texcoconensis]MBB5174603.1 hypothetical protein [Texcoconibacillus texcoconensis]
MSRVRVRLHGEVASEGDADVAYNEFLDGFVQFLEEKGWSYSGVSFQVDDEGNEVAAIDGGPDD